MKTKFFDALVNFLPQDKSCPLDTFLIVQGVEVSASFHFYNQTQKEKHNQFLARVCLRRPLSLKWRDKFEVQAKNKEERLGKVTVLDPASPKLKKAEMEKRISFLWHLVGDEKEMLFALSKEKGIRGLMEREIRDFCRMSENSLRLLSQELEEKGEIRILSFSPLFLLSQESFDFLCEKIVAFLSQFHKKHPEERGISFEKIKKRFELPRKILSLALKSLARVDKIREMGNLVALSSFEITLAPQEEDILRKLEEMCFRGKFCSVSLKELEEQFHLSPNKLERMLTFLIEKKKIVQGKDGFVLHRSLLDEIIWKIKKLGKNELTVSDFKKMTGLSRKYAIPLLELLDEMGITRRKGPSREIL